LTALEVKGKGKGRVRAGAFALSLLSAPLNVLVLQALEAEATSLMDLRRAAGSPPQTTLRKQLQALTGIGVIAKRRRPSFPGAVDYKLTGPGQELMRVAAILQGWLNAAPEGPLALGDRSAKSAIKALVEGWSSTLIRALAGRPLALTELDALISGLSYPSLERRLVSMRMAGQVNPCTGPGRGTPYAVTDWLRMATAPLAAAVHWERQHAPEEAAPVGRLDVEAAFLLAMPLLRLPTDQSGVCRLAVGTANGDQRRLAGVLVGVEEGRVAYCRARLEGNANAWASGSTTSWLRAVLERDTDNLEIGGDCQLAYEIVARLRETRAEEHAARTPGP
jgi:DNA-binding HxlR family transcriptional regulator